MIIAINGMYLTNQAVGIANVIINVANEFAKMNQVIIFANKAILPEIKNRLSQTIIYEENNNKLYFRKPIWFFLKFPKALRKYKVDYLWNPAVWMPLGINKHIKTIVTVHDFVSRDFKSTMRFFNRLISSCIEKYSIQKADYLWCVSEYTQNLLEQYYPNRKCKKNFVGSAPDPFIKKIDDKIYLDTVKKELGLPCLFLLFVGSLEPRKNLKFLLSVYKEYAKLNEQMNLVIVGAKGWGKTEISEIITSKDFPKDRVLFTGFVSEEQLRALYNLAAVYISTSLNEGFGLPQVEAMNCEVPVISPHNSAMIEVVSGAGVTVNSWNIRDWINAIDYVQRNRKSIIAKQNERRKNYNWNAIIPKFYEYLGI